MGLSQDRRRSQLGVERKFGLGWSAPRLSGSRPLSFSGIGARREGSGSALFRPRQQLNLANVLERAAWPSAIRPAGFRRGALFDSAAREAGISGWFDLLSLQPVLFMNYATFRYGDVVSHATPPRPDIAAITIVRACNVFGSGAEAIASTPLRGKRSAAGVDQSLTTMF